MERKETIRDLIEVAENVTVYFDTAEICVACGFEVIVNKTSLLAELAKNELLDWTEEELREEEVWRDFRWIWDTETKLLRIYMR